MVTQPVDLARNGSANGELHVCPTRIDRAAVLFAHRVSKAMCQSRQRGHYHKCFSCAWNNVWLAAHGAPVRYSGVERRSATRAG